MFWKVGGQKKLTSQLDSCMIKQKIHSTIIELIWVCSVYALFMCVRLHVWVWRGSSIKLNNLHYIDFGLGYLYRWYRKIFYLLHGRYVTAMATSYALVPKIIVKSLQRRYPDPATYHSIVSSPLHRYRYAICCRYLKPRVEERVEGGVVVVKPKPNEGIFSKAIDWLEKLIVKVMYDSSSEPHHYLSGNFAPVPETPPCKDLPVKGYLPVSPIHIYLYIHLVFDNCNLRFLKFAR